MNVILIKNENISRISVCFFFFFFTERFSAPRTQAGTCELNRRKNRTLSLYGTCAKQYDWGTITGVNQLYIVPRRRRRVLNTHKQ